MKFLSTAIFPFILFIGLVVIATFVALGIFLVKALGRYIRSTEVRKEKAMTKKSLGEVLKQHRVDCKMTQEFVAETIGVSRQAVSKWENGTSEPNTSNLMALARLYGIPAEDLLKGVESALEAQEK